MTTTFPQLLHCKLIFLFEMKNFPSGLALLYVIWIQKNALAQFEFRTMDCRPAFECQALRCDPRPKWYGRKRSALHPITCEGMVESPLRQNISERIDRLQKNFNQTSGGALQARSAERDTLKTKLSESEEKMKRVAIRDVKFELSKTKDKLQHNARVQTESTKQAIVKEMDNEFDWSGRIGMSSFEATVDQGVAKASDDLRGEIFGDMDELEERIRSLVASSTMEEFGENQNSEIGELMRELLGKQLLSLMRGSQ